MYRRNLGDGDGVPASACDVELPIHGFSVVSQHERGEPHDHLLVYGVVHLHHTL